MFVSTTLRVASGTVERAWITHAQKSQSRQVAERGRDGAREVAVADSPARSDVVRDGGGTSKIELIHAQLCEANHVAQGGRDGAAHFGKGSGAAQRLAGERDGEMCFTHSTLSLERLPSEAGMEPLKLVEYRILRAWRTAQHAAGWRQVLRQRVHVDAQ